MNKNITNKRTFADRIIGFFQKLYTPVLNLALRFKILFVIATIVLFAVSYDVYSHMGGEFIPTLEEGDFALHQILPPGSSLSQSVDVSKIIQKKLLAEFPEVEDVVTKIGSAEIPTDPMPVETGDIMVIMKPKSEWTTAKTKQGLFEKMEESLLEIPGVAYEFSQPIQMRFNELMTGSRADIAIKLYGQDLDLLYAKGKEAESIIRQVAGVGSVKVEQTVGMPQIVIDFKYDKMAQYGLRVKEVNQVVRAAFAGEKAGTVYEGDNRFDLVVRLAENYRNDISDVQDLYVTLENGTQVPLSAVADVELKEAPMQISRDNTNRRIVIGVNVGNSDVESLVEKIQNQLDEKIALPAGYYFTYGGQFENLKAANARLAIAVPIALAMIFILLFFTFGSASQALLIFTAIPLSAIGGIWALQLRHMPFSISAGIGFIALFGVAVLNGIVLIGYFNELKNEGVTDIRERIITGTTVRLRPVLMTALVASLGFLPMALSTSGGAGVQRPLATVVIGGLISATFLTLIVLPILYSWLANWQERKGKTSTGVKGLMILLPFLFLSHLATAQQVQPISLERAVEMATTNHPSIRAADLQIDQRKSLQNLKYSLGPTGIQYQGDGLFRENNQRIHEIGVVQNFKSPAGLKAQNAMQDKRVAQAVLQKQQTEKELELQVMQLYADLQHRKELALLYQDNIDWYATYLKIAEVRVNLGAANRMEVLNISSAISEYQLLIRQANLEISSMEMQLNTLLRGDNLYTTMDVFELKTYATSSELNSFQLQLAQQNIQMQQAGAALIKSESKPDFLIGYALQNYFEGGWLSAVQAGVQINLFNKQIKQKVEAQRMQVEVVKAEYEILEAGYEQQRARVVKSIELYETGAAYYQQQLTEVYPEMERIAKLNYEAGELSYLELMNTRGLFSKNKKQYLEQVLAQNKGVALLGFLTGK